MSGVFISYSSLDRHDEVFAALLRNLRDTARAASGLSSWEIRDLLESWRTPSAPPNWSAIFREAFRDLDGLVVRRTRRLRFDVQFETGEFDRCAGQDPTVQTVCFVGESDRRAADRTLLCPDAPVDCWAPAKITFSFCFTTWQPQTSRAGSTSLFEAWSWFQALLLLEARQPQDPLIALQQLLKLIMMSWRANTAQQSLAALATGTRRSCGSSTSHRSPGRRVRSSGRPPRGPGKRWTSRPSAPLNPREIALA